MKRITCFLFALLLTIALVPVSFADGDAKDLRIIFTHDIHSYFDIAETTIDGVIREHGGAARLATIIKENTNDHTVYLDGGDFSMGTLMMAGYTTDAYELRLLGQLGCAATTFGNHEFDFDGTGAAKMLRSAMASGDPLPLIVQSNMITDAPKTDTQRTLISAMDEYGVKKYTVIEKGGVKIALFGLLGIDGIECAPTSGMEFTDYIESAKATVAQIKAEADADMIVCLSHSGTSGDGVNGEDFELAKAVPDIDVILSGHSHTKYAEPVTVGNTVVMSAGEYLSFVGVIDLKVSDGVTVADYKLVPCDESVAEDAAVAKTVAAFKENIQGTYLSRFGMPTGLPGTTKLDPETGKAPLIGSPEWGGLGYDDLLCKSDFDFITLGEMYATHGEYPLGNLIADSYLYEARKYGIDDIDVALVGLGTIRGSIYKGNVTVSDAFEICSLGVGADGSAGHPIIGAYVTGKDLKLLIELDASLGPMVSSIKMSYAGLRYTFNEKRMILDRVTEARIVRADGTEEEIEDERLYKVSCNMYAANMLGMLNGLTKGILSITPKNADGTPVEDFYACSLKDNGGNEIKEWVAFRDYLASFPKTNGIPTIPQKYAAPEGRKLKVSEGGLAVIKNPGAVTLVVIIVPIAIIALIVVLCATRKKRKARRAQKKAAKAAKKADKA